jgi:hypothetical protein
VSMSDHAYAAMCAYESARGASYRDTQEVKNELQSLFIETMIIHLKECHGMGEKKISEMLGLKRSFVRKFLKQRKEGGAS